MFTRLNRLVLPSWLTPSVAALILANLVPLAGVLWMGWEVGDVVLLYWIENLIVGVFNVLRILAVRIRDPAAWLGKLVLIPFFAVHYGGFAAVHGVLLTAMFRGQGSGDTRVALGRQHRLAHHAGARADLGYAGERAEPAYARLRARSP